ncbi:DUF262 domain-containing protein [Gallibacterium anatis]|uniref:DUF262 domain-containing protein n=1 Tax=Gallibacterium anatis (strain UMN179) TaxID=1005058 RepID=F4HAN0_GALAU|nr:DUF262 domain-containing protein [Gallibacterium anatis]AEC16192.1 hypothetical protein UMN179_00155 [Gallibacterium anatis UMN179]KGQ46331.1 hypothetical protein JP29_03020 [Gallibacterium anatis]OZN49627.1 DUF262 domain-containing protein [Gallibacterium anatis]WIM85114.1 DUF262 domain-containing HNH endonuclease family protein [Gallibacterium anatis]
MENNQVKTLTVSELCNGDNYIIPIYQRNYAWGRDEIELLIEDILEAQVKNKGNNYYIGSLVVAKRKDSYEVIDGQQRLTTLKLLLSYFNQSPNINLTFEHRDESNQSLNNLGDNKYGNNIEIGYKFILDIFSKKIVQENKENNFNEEEFSSFLQEKVVILRTEVPEDTDLNHYFEIMNNRGEQLEKHEVLKARLMEKLLNEDKKLFALIWDACSDMSVYAIKRFPYSNDESKNIRTSDAFFGELVNKIPESFDKMKDILNKIEYTDKETNKESILNLLEQTDNKINQDKGSDEDGNFQSIIDFPNFLMIVYKIFRGGDVPLNDKYLLNKFEEIGDEPATIKEFIILLLKVRLIFDRYIIKSKEEEDSWILNGIKKYKDGSFREVNTFGTALEQLNKDSDKDGDTDDLSKNHIQIVQLLSMFHTSFRQNKSWLFDILEKLSKSSELENTYSLSAVEYIEILEQLAYDYYKNSKRQELFKSGGQNIPNYIFNYLDYLLWKDWDNRGKDNKFLKKSDFVFSLSRNSIEHYLAQSKRDSLLPRNETEENKNRLLNSLGNLCLISHYQNSSLNDEVPSEKRKRYESGSLKCISPKQALMLSYEIWGKEEIEKHNEDMIEILDSETKKYINNIS